MRRRTSLVLIAFLVVSGCGREFDAAAWQAAGPDGRGQMCGDLMSKHTLVGTPLEAVVALLGKPDSENHYVSYWLGPHSDDAQSSGRFAVHFRDARVSLFHRDGLPSGERPAAVPFDRAGFLAGQGRDRLAMLDALMAREAEFVGRPVADVVGEFGPPSWVWHDAYYALSPVDDDPGGFNSFEQRQLTLSVDERGVVTAAEDRVITD